jgi:hypothetical protein
VGSNNTNDGPDSIIFGQRNINAGAQSIIGGYNNKTNLGKPDPNKNNQQNGDYYFVLGSSN